MLPLGGQNRDAVAEDLGDQVDDPCNTVSDTGNQAENANDQGNNVLRLKETNDTINTADQTAKENLQDNLKQLRKCFVGGGDRATFCHDMYLFFKILSKNLLTGIIISSCKEFVNLIKTKITTKKQVGLVVYLLS